MSILFYVYGVVAFVLLGLGLLITYDKRASSNDRKIGARMVTLALVWPLAAVWLLILEIIKIYKIGWK